MSSEFARIARLTQLFAEHAPAPPGIERGIGDAVSITTTLLGTCTRPIERRAEAGDGIWIAGSVGLAAAGLAALERKLESDAALRDAIAAWRRPRARIADGLAMAALAHGAID